MDLKEKVAAFFAKNPNAEKCYSTTDGNVFAAEHYANNWARGFKEDAVLTHTREVVAEKPKAENSEAEEVKTTEGSEQKTEVGEAEEKATLVKRFIELYDTKPSHNMKLETLKAKIAEKEAESQELKA